ncbi:MAG: hypothetical protein HKL91_06870 [Candidatus Eremiobacteraeota bacterium]|nr:hypothetical protein [Candidatus Eremiobacteraeota bacterium]
MNILFRKIFAGATLALAVAAGAAAQAQACFPVNGGCVFYLVCSYNQNGTGGFYIAHTYNFCED